MHIHKHGPSRKANQALLWVTNNEDKLEKNVSIYSTQELRISRFAKEMLELNHKKIK